MSVVKLVGMREGSHSCAMDMGKIWPDTWPAIPTKQVNELSTEEIKTLIEAYKVATDNDYKDLEVCNYSHGEELSEISKELSTRLRLSIQSGYFENAYELLSLMKEANRSRIQLEKECYDSRAS
jgi:hypothetical protein